MFTYKVFNYTLSFSQLNLLSILCLNSTSRHIEVATRFAGSQGVVLEFSNETLFNSEYLHGFDCDWFSSFREEDETLFMGGHYKVKIESVRTIKSSNNYKLFFKAMGMFDEMLNGKYAPKQTWDKNKVTEKEKSIICDLYSWKLGREKANYKDIPKYIYDTFLIFTKGKKQIILNSDLLDSYLSDKELNSLVMNDMKSEYWMKKDSGLFCNVFCKQIFAIFDNLQNILLYTTFDAYVNESRVYPFSFFGLLSIINGAKFKQITIKATCYEYEDESWLSVLWKRDCIELVKKYNQYGLKIFLAERVENIKYIEEDCVIIVK